MPFLSNLNWLTITWPLVIGVCVALGLINLRVAIGDGNRNAAPHWFFSLAALSVGGIALFEFLLMHTQELAVYQRLLRWASIPIMLMVVSILGFICTFFGTGRRWLAILAALVSIVVNLLSFFIDRPVVRYAVGLNQGTTFGGAEFIYPTIENGPWNGLEFVGVLFAGIYIGDASWSLWKSGGRRRALVVGGSVLFFLWFSRFHALLVEQGIVHTPYLVGFGFLGVVIAMGLELSDDVLHASRLARELQESQHRVDLAGRAASVGFWEWNLLTNQIWANETARDIFGIQGTEPIDFERFLKCIHPEDQEGVSETVRQTLETGAEYEREYRICRGDGEPRWVNAWGRYEKSASGKPVLMRGVLLDVTESRVSELELQILRGQLAHVGRVSMMGQLAAALAHELNQPLGAILRNAEAADLFLQSPHPDLIELREIIQDIIRDDTRAGGVIDRLKALLKRRDIEIRPLNLRDLLEEVHSLLRGEAVARGVRLQLISGPLDLQVAGDRVHLQQVLINLVMNAMDALVDLPANRRIVKLESSLSEEGLVEVSVSDLGLGIPFASQNQVFDPFFTTKPNGMGMGLAICRTIIEAHGGTIGFESNDQGTRMWFQMPCTEVSGKA